MTKLAVIGGSYLQLPVVKRAKEMGIEVHCFAWTDGAVCADVADYFYPVSIIEKEKIYELCARIGIDGILTIASDLAVLTVNYVAEKLGLISNPERYSGITTNKLLMRGCFDKEGVPSPKFVAASDSELPDVSGFAYPLIVKPADRSGSRGVEKVLEKEALLPALKRACAESFSGNAVIEEFVEGREISVEGISFNGKHHLLQITDKVTTGAPYFVELAHHQPSSLDDDTKARVKKVVLKALDALHIKYGASHSELKITPEGEIKVIEIGARMGGDFIGSDLVKLSVGYDFLKGVIEVALGRFTEPEINESHCSGVYFICKETEALVPVVENQGDYPEIVLAEITDPSLKYIQQSADRSGYIIYQSHNRPAFGDTLN